MDAKKLFSVFLLFLIICITTSFASRKSDRKKENSENSEVHVNDGDAGVISSSELQQLRELASKESGSIILSTPKPKHARRKNRRRPQSRGRPNKKTRTRPTDILKAEDDVKGGKKQSEVIPNEGNEERPQKQRNRARGSRHLAIDSKTEIAGSHSHKTHSKHHHLRQHRRLRARAHHHRNHKHRNSNGNVITENHDPEQHQHLSHSPNAQ